jgi:bacillithiol biosynthesis cysteine-adding enzyme BshC
VQANPSELSARVAAVSAVSIDVRRLPGVKRLAADYAYAFGALAPFFAGDPSDRAAWADAVARAQSHPRRSRELAAVLRAQQQRRGAPPAALAAAERLSDPRTVAVLTGQQAGLFGGPLFTILKALTALKLAEQVTRDHGAPAVAVFWIEAEDHDWDEVRSCTVFDGEMATRTVSLPPRTGDPLPVAAVPLDSHIADVLTELEQILPSTEFRASLIADLRATYATGVGMAEAFGRWLDRVLGDRGLVVYDASDPATKPFVADLFRRELSSPGQTAKLAAQAGADLVARGFHTQVHTPEDSVDGVALFRIDTHGRRPIQARNGGFVVNDQSVAPAALAQEAVERPAAFSPSVLLRPIVQDTIFPTVCYVAGPNELAYLGQLRGIYARFGVPMPLMYSRATATLVDSSAARFLAKNDVPFESLHAQDDSALNELLKMHIPADVDQALGDAVRVVDEQMERVIRTLPALDPTLEGAARTTLTRMQKDLETLQGKTIQAAKRRNDTLRRQFLRTRALTFPNGHAQERTISFISFLNQYGSSLVERLWQELPVGLGQHWIVTI